MSLPYDKDNRLIVSPENAEKFRTWIKERGGLFVWTSKLIGEIPRSWTTPATTTTGQPFLPPDWRCGNTPDRHITLSDEVAVEETEELARRELAYNANGTLRKGLRSWKDAQLVKHPDAWAEFRGDGFIVIVRTKSTTPLKDYHA